MSDRSPQLDVTVFDGPKFAAFRHWLAMAARKLGLLPRALVARKTWNPGSIASGSFDSTTVSVPGAIVGDAISVGFAANMIGGMLPGGTMERNGEVVAALYNFSGSPQNFGSHELTVIVWRLDR